jgi:hypothetical protein
MLNDFGASMTGIFVILIGNGFYDVFMDRSLPAVTDTPPPLPQDPFKLPTKTTKRKSKKV